MACESVLVIELVTLELGLKPYHMNGLQETQQQLMAEAPPRIFELAGKRENLMK